MSQYPLRVPDYLMEQARTAAEEENVSINQLLVSFIAEGIGQRKAWRALQKRAGRGDPKKALAILESLNGQAPEPGDDMPDISKR
ncbi:hypothetical protein [Neorhizobium sp. DT-125]|uniref:hypothetical protein n=1 Tax=Neorhizobium sp. DT-125 TaxID=3396163 RepID=UPI003F1E3AC2